MDDSYYKGFPDPTASRETKAAEQYGLDYARAIWADFTKNSTLYDDMREQQIINRKYAEGLESIQKYKNRLDLEDSSYLNLDFTPVNRIATIVDNIEGKLMNQTYKVQCNPIDAESMTKFDDYRKKIYANLYMADISKQMEEEIGMSLIPKGEYVPKSSVDAQMHLKLNYKMDASLAMEEAIDWVDNNNDFPDTRRRILRDLIVLKRAALHRFYDHNNNIKHEYVDPVDLITPYSKHDDFRNVTFQAIQKQYQIWQLAEMNPAFTNEDLYYIAKAQAGQNKNPRWTYGTSYEGYYQSNNGDYAYVNFNVTVLQFFFLTQNADKRVKKKNSKGGSFFNKKPSNYSLKVKADSINVVDNGKFWMVKGEKLQVPKSKQRSMANAQEYFAGIKTRRREENTEVFDNLKKYRYEGYWIPDTEWIWDYGMTKNIEREKIGGSYSPDTELPISIIAPNIYDMQNKSLVERLIPFEDGLNLANLKFQQLLIKAVPPGIQFDVDALDGVITKMGEDTKPDEILKLYLQTGSFPFSSTREDGTTINGPAVSQLPNGIGKEFNAYIATQQHYMQLMNDVIGFNSAVDASTPNADALVGVQKMAVNATNNALRPLYSAHINLIKRSQIRIALMIQDSMQFNEKAFKMAIGAQAAATIRHGRKIAFNQFAIDLELAPDEEEKIQIEALIQLGIQTQTLFPSDAIRIRQELKSNAKLASQLLVLLEEKNRTNKLEESMKLQEQNAQVQMQSAQAAKQAETESAMAMEQAKQQTMQMEYQLKEQLNQADHGRNMQHQELENVGAQKVAIINNEGKQVVQQQSNQGKQVVQSQSDEAKKEIEEIKNDGKLRQTAFDNATKPKEEKKPAAKKK